MQASQKRWSPIGPPTPPRTVSPFVTRRAAAGTIMVSEKALAVMRWQPRQWQAMVMKGGAETSISTAPQRQVPRVRSKVIRLLLAGPRLDGYSPEIGGEGSGFCACHRGFGGEDACPNHAKLSSPSRVDDRVVQG